MFLNIVTCFLFTPHTHQWYRINTKEILQNHKLAFCTDKVAHMVPLPSAEPPVINVYMTILRVTLQQNQDSQDNAHGKQPQCTSTPLVYQPTGRSHQSQNVHPHNQSILI